MWSRKKTSTPHPRNPPKRRQKKKKKPAAPTSQTTAHWKKEEKGSHWRGYASHAEFDVLEQKSSTFGTSTIGVHYHQMERNTSA